MECEGIGPDRAESIAEWFADEDNLRLVGELRELGLTLKVGDDDMPVEGPLTGRQYVITGTLERFFAPLVPLNGLVHGGTQVSG